MLLLYELCRWNSIWFVCINSDAGVRCHCCSEFVWFMSSWEMTGKKITGLVVLII